MDIGDGSSHRHPEGNPVRGILIGSLLSLFLFGGLYFAYSYSRRPSPAAPAPKPEATQVAAIEPIDRGNGVFYFPVTGEQYIESLAKFYEGNGKHCDLQGFTERGLFFNAANGSKEPHYTPYGGTAEVARTETTGFILHCHDLAVEAQSVTIP